MNNRRIDLVVTGRSAPLAVECDGDALVSTPAQRISDLEREQELKRCGWVFWRVRESEYHLDQAAAMSSLWDTLENVGIAPHSVRLDAESIPSVSVGAVDCGRTRCGVDEPPQTDAVGTLGNGVGGRRV